MCSQWPQFYVHCYLVARVFCPCLVIDPSFQSVAPAFCACLVVNDHSLLYVFAQFTCPRCPVTHRGQSTGPLCPRPTLVHQIKTTRQDWITYLDSRLNMTALLALQLTSDQNNVYWRPTAARSRDGPRSGLTVVRVFLARPEPNPY